jgi:hypothetical protein
MSAGLPICPSVRTTGRIPVKFDIGDFCQHLLRKIHICLKWDKLSDILREDVSFTVAGDIKSPHKRLFQVQWFQAVRLAEEVKTLHERATVFTLYLHCLFC